MNPNKSKMKKPKCSVCGARHDLHNCVGCDEWFCERHIEFDADPYASEIAGDDSPVWECEPCRDTSAYEI